MDPKATAGRSVHYTMDDGTPRAAIVNVDIENEAGVAPELTVFFGNGPRVLASVSYAEPPMAGAWSWMPYQHEKAKTAEGNVSESAEPRPDEDSKKDDKDDDKVPEPTPDLPPATTPVEPPGPQLEPGAKPQPPFSG